MAKMANIAKVAVLAKVSECGEIARTTAIARIDEMWPKLPKWYRFTYKTKP